MTPGVSRSLSHSTEPDRDAQYFETSNTVLIWAIYPIANTVSRIADLYDGDKTAKTTEQPTFKRQVFPCPPPFIISQN